VPASVANSVADQLGLPAALPIHRGVCRPRVQIDQIEIAGDDRQRFDAVLIQRSASGWLDRRSESRRILFSMMSFMIDRLLFPASTKPGESKVGKKAGHRGPDAIRT
jgi:hypothetical protein